MTPCTGGHQLKGGGHRADTSRVVTEPTFTVVADDPRPLLVSLIGQGLARDDDSPDVIVVVATVDLSFVAKAAAGDRRVLAVVEVADRRSTTVLLDLGADGVTLDEGDPEVLAAAVRAIHAGFLVVPRSVRQALRRPVLTSRQKQILSLVVMGLSNAEIAERLFLTEATIKAHLTQVFAKLGVRSRKEAIDLIHDPTAGLGAGILGIPDADRVQSGYGTPSVG